MITTVTLNPSIDVSYPLDTLKIDTVNRVTEVRKTAGGKGLNVTRVLNDLSADVEATGVLGGYFGQYIQQQLEDQHIQTAFLSIAEETRYCIAMLHEGNQTEILEAGPTVTPEEAHAFIQHFQDHLRTGQVVTISGSMVRGFEADTYAQLIEAVNAKNGKVLLDTSGKSLETALLSDHKPYLIKPNNEELEGLLDTTVDVNAIDILKSQLNHPLFDGVEVIVISLGADGALVKAHGQFYRVTVPKIEAVNPVGSGDATIAGLAYAIDKGKAIEDVLASGMACGVLNALNPNTGSIDASQFESYRQKIQVTAL